MFLYTFRIGMIVYFQTNRNFINKDLEILSKIINGVFFEIPHPFVYLLEPLDKDGGSICAIKTA